MLSRSNWNAFYNTTTLASYHFDLQLVVLDDVDSRIITALGIDAKPARYKVFGLAAHEYTHWLDHVSTLWGRRLLNRFYDGVTAWQNQDVSNFPQILQAKRAIARCTSRRYYQVEGPKSGARPPWMASLTVGLAFNGEGAPNTSDPIPFIKFWVPPSTEEGNLIIRMPITAASLSEVRAMHAEYSWILSEELRYQSKTPADSADWLGQYTDKIYNQDFLEYSTALHLLANETGATQVGQLLPYASALAGIALNFPTLLVGKLKVPKLWIETWGPGNEDGNRVAPLLNARDPGFLFSLLCSYATNPGTSKIEDWLEAVLNAAGNVSLVELTTEWRRELQSSMIVDEPGSLPEYLRMLWLNGGLNWTDLSYPAAPPDLLLRALNSEPSPDLPGALTLDEDVWFPTSGKLYGDKIEILKRNDWLLGTVRKMDVFCDACILG